MKRLDRTHLFTILLALILAAAFFRPHPEPNSPLTGTVTAPPSPVVASATPSPQATPVAFSLPELDGGLGGLGFKVDLQQGTYEYTVDPPPKTGSSALGLHRGKKEGSSLNIRLAP